MAYDFAVMSNVEGRLCLINAGHDHFNYGSVIECYVIPEKDIVSFPTYRFPFDQYQRAILSGEILLRSGVQAYRFRFTPDTGSFSEPMQEDDNGIYYDQLFTIQIPKDRPEITYLKHVMRWGRYTIIYRDANALTKIMRNSRVKFDYQSGKNRSEYNGHTFFARRAALEPSFHFDIATGSSVSDIFAIANVVMDYYQEQLPEGWQTGKVITLPATPYSPESAVIIYNSSLKLRLGNHYNLQDNRITLQFSDDIDMSLAADIQVFFAKNDEGSDIAAWNQHVDIKTASYTSGMTITLPSPPINEDHLIIQKDDTLLLRYGSDFTLSGNVVTILFSGSPTPSDEDVFHFFYATSGTPLTINGWKQYGYTAPTLLPINSTFELPHSPVANSLLIWMDGNLMLRPGTHYNIVDNEVEILFEVDAGTLFDCWYAFS